MARKHKIVAAARARAGKKKHPLPPPHLHLPEANPDLANPSPATEFTDHVLFSSEPESDCGYTGGVDCSISDTESDSEWIDSGSGDSDGSISEFCGQELEENLREIREEVEVLHAASPYALIMGKKLKKDWRKVERNRALGYTGNSVRSKQRHAKDARERELQREAACNSCVLHIHIFAPIC